MSFTRPIANANGEWICQRNTELSDVIRARNKREDRFLNVRVKFYEREKNVRLNFIRQEQSQLERVRTAISEAANRVLMKRQNAPAWMSPRPKTGGRCRQIIAPESIFPDWQVNQPPPVSTTNIVRRHSAR